MFLFKFSYSEIFYQNVSITNGAARITIKQLHSTTFTIYREYIFLIKVIRFWVIIVTETLILGIDFSESVYIRKTQIFHIKKHIPRLQRHSNAKIIGT